MTEPYLDQWRQDWQGIDTGNGIPSENTLRAMVRRRRARSLALLALESLGSALCIVAAWWFVRQVGGALGWASAVMLALVIPAMLVLSFRARRWALARADVGAGGSLKLARRSIEASLKAVQISRWHCWLLAGFVAVLWLLQLLGLLQYLDFLILYSLISALVLAILIPLLAYRERRLRRQLQQCSELLDQHTG